MKAQTKQMLKSALFESTFVVLGVVLALAANEWRTNYAEDKAAKNALNEIQQEIESNQALVEASRVYHASLLETLYSLSYKKEKPDIKLFSKGFVSPAKITDTAWTSALNTGVLENIEYDKVLELSRVYDLQIRYVRQSNSIGDIIYERLFDGGVYSMLESSHNLASIISTLQFREQELQKQYKSSLDALKQVKK